MPVICVYLLMVLSVLITYLPNCYIYLLTYANKMPISAKKLSHFCGSDTVIGSLFRGLYPSDMLDTAADYIDYNKKNCFIIHSNGHFTAIFIDMQNKKLLSFCDSMAKQPKTYGEEVVEFIDYSMSKYSEVPFRLQSYSSDLCGVYVVFMLRKLCEDIPLKQAVKMFEPNQYKTNDKIVLSWMKHNYDASLLNDLLSDLKK